jgi:general secretion pathway protein N
MWTGRGLTANSGILVMRSSAVLMVWLLAVGDAGALRAAAPPEADAHDDLFAPKLNNPAPDLASPAVQAAGPNPTAPPDGAARDDASAAKPKGQASESGSPAEAMQDGNPLWALPLTRFIASRERPLFAPSRRPPPVAAVAQPMVTAPVAPPPKPAEPEKPQLSLLGTVAGSTAAEGVGLFIDDSSKAVVRLKAGEDHKGWLLRAVRPRQVELAKGLDSAVLDLPPPDAKTGPAPGPALAMPVMPTLPVSATPASSANTAGGAPAGLPPPTFHPPPPQVNPFQAKLVR